MALRRALSGVDGQIVTTLFIAVPSGTAKNDPVMVGFVHGVAMTDRDTNGNATVAIPPTQVFRINVNASDDVDTSPLSSPSAVAFGDKLYAEANSEVVSKDASDDNLFGIALGTRDSNGAYQTGEQIAAGEVDECDVMLVF